MPFSTERRVRILMFGIWAGVIVSAGGLSLICYWKFVSPAPRMHVIHSEIAAMPGGGAVLHRPGVFEVRRVTESDADATGRISALFEHKPPADPIRLPDGREAIPDRMQFQLADATEFIERGRHYRTRIWETPRLLPPGEYIYRSV